MSPLLLKRSRSVSTYTQVCKRHHGNTIECLAERTIDDIDSDSNQFHEDYCSSVYDEQSVLGEESSPYNFGSPPPTQNITTETISESKLLSRPYRCPYVGCEKSYTKPSKLDLHILSHTGERPFKCPFPNCGKSYRRKEHLQVHCLSHDPNNPKPFKCNHVCPNSGLKCHNCFATRYHLRRHQKVHKADKTYQCALCSLTFAKHHQLRKHLSDHTGKHPYPCTKCDKSFKTNQKLKKHLDTHDETARYHCGHRLCLQAFSTWTKLQSHINQTHKSQPSCRFCLKLFSTQSTLNEHLKTHDEYWTELGIEKQRFKCTWDSDGKECGKVFTKEKNLNTHIRVVHRGIKPYVCSQCQKAFSYKHVLNRHQNSCAKAILSNDNATELDSVEGNLAADITGAEYENSRSIICPFYGTQGCLRRFKRTYDLDRHIRSAHSTDLRPSQPAETMHDSGSNLKLSEQFASGDKDILSFDMQEKRRRMLGSTVSELEANNILLRDVAAEGAIEFDCLEKERCIEDDRALLREVLRGKGDQSCKQA
ncbi:hypothetical protein BKA69DRAFT_1119941 [Paraphysoderma sedebokerense]|nr:hypothetical protein BKA69DRAFT_1119941 [Paraphysoderma sedebokerense]